MNELRILIVEDEPIIAENISIYLNNNDFIVSAIAYDDDEAMHQLKWNTPDAVLLDINLDCSRDGIDIAEVINKNYNLPFLFLTSYADKETLQRAKNVQPSGYIVKPFHEKTLLSSLEIAISNHALRLNREAPFPDLERINANVLSVISEREYEVMRCIYDGKTNNQIAAELYVSINTVKVHLKNLYLKLDVDSRTTALARLRQFMPK
jgi:DNA-binding NarL/FixJ family response regulator